MKNYLLATAALFITGAVMAQQKQGRVIYERTITMNIQIADMGEGMQQMMPKTRTDKFELMFTSDRTLWRQPEPDKPEEEDVAGDAGGMHIRVAAMGSNDVFFTDLAKGTTTQLRDFMDKNFIIDDSIRPMKWKMTGETKTILGHSCMKATSSQISKRMMMTMNDGQMERKEIMDTSAITAWIATDIPVSTGPSEFQGQLPGLILEIDVNNGRQSYKATEIKSDVDLALIKEPAGKKHCTMAEFRKESDKMMKEMQQNNGGRGRTIMISN